MSTFQKVTHRDGKKLRVNLDLARVAAATDKDGCEIQFSPDHVVTAGETVEKVMTIPSPLDEARACPQLGRSYPEQTESSRK